MDPQIQSATLKRRKRLALTGVALLLSAAGVVSLFLVRHRSTRSHATAPEKLSVVHLEPFVLNLSDPDEHTYLRLGLDLAVASPPEPKKTDARTSASLIRDTVLDVLMSATSKDLESADQKRQLKQTILQQLNARSPELKVREVYFTEFLVQR